MTIEAKIIGALITQPEAKGVFLATATDPNPILAGYCIGALDDLACADELPPEVLARTEVIKHRLGCFVMEIPLGKWAALCIERYGEDGK